MNPIEWKELLTLIISALAFGCSLTLVILTYKRDSKKDNSDGANKEVRIAESFKELNVKLDFQSKQLDKLTINSEESTKQFIEINNKVTKIVEQITALFRYKDDHEERIRELEEKIK